MLKLTNVDLIQRVNALRSKLRSPNGIQQLEAINSLVLVIDENWDNIERALIFSRLTVGGPY